MLEGILSISGMPGLYKLISQTKNGIIVESFDTKKRLPIYSNAKVSALEDIAIFTDDKETPLKEVFQKIYTIENKQASSVGKKSTDSEIKDYFEDILPDYDKERVYVSDMKKVISWYNTLLEKDLLNFEEKKQQEENSEIDNKDEKADAPVKAPKAKATPKTVAKPVSTKVEAKPKSSKATSPKTIQRKSN